MNSDTKFKIYFGFYLSFVASLGGERTGAVERAGAGELGRKAGAEEDRGVGPRRCLVDGGEGSRAGERLAANCSSESSFSPGSRRSVPRIRAKSTEAPADRAARRPTEHRQR